MDTITWCLVLLALAHTHCQPQSLAAQTSPKDYTGHQLIRVLPEGKEHTRVLQRLKAAEEDGVNFWVDPVPDRRAVDIHLSPTKDADVKRLLADSGIDYNTISDNLQGMIDEESEHSRHRRSTVDEPTAELNHTFYHRCEEIYDWLDSVANTCGSRCRVFSIGTSSEGRDLKVIQLGSADDNKPVIWIDSGIHAREWISPATSIYIISKLLAPGRVSNYLTRRFTWYFMPLANPDGYAYTWTHDRMWRKTRSVHPAHPCRGADPNRNWEYNWAGRGTSAHPCSENFRGQTPFSEPETRAMATFLGQIQSNLTVYISLHSYGQYWLTPWGYTATLPTDYDNMARMGQEAARAIRMVNGTNYQVGASSRLLYLAAGGSDDWVKGVLGVPYAYTVELRDTGRYGFILPATYIEVTGREIHQGIRALAFRVLRTRQQRANGRSYLLWNARSTRPTV